VSLETRSGDIVPVVLFAYARPAHLKRTLDCLRAEAVPMIYAFSDGPRTPAQEAAVAEVRGVLRGIDWCDVRLVERGSNLGLGRSIRSGVGEVLGKHDAVLVFEDDLVCSEGAYSYLVAAMAHYRDDDRVMSVTGWTHPLVIPGDVGDQPYFDGRAECLVWGTWARSWVGMDRDARTLARELAVDGGDPYRYGADLVEMAAVEAAQNIWAVRWLYLHMVGGGVCLRPPWSLVEHIGFDELATNAQDGSKWANPPLKPCPPLPARWPEPTVHPDCSRLWQAACGGRPSWGVRAGTLIRRVVRYGPRRLWRSVRGLLAGT
jgi:hypothetical protein